MRKDNKKTKKLSNLWAYKKSELENINDGGAALTAYGKIQYTDMTKQEREEISKSLKRYCELDTLAMVMIYEHLKSLV